jgi:hypothetical protein
MSETMPERDPLADQPDVPPDPPGEMPEDPPTPETPADAEVPF